MAQHALTQRDVLVLGYVTRHGVCTPDQIATAAPEGEPFFTSQWACYRRLRALEKLSLIIRKPTWWHGPHVVLPTRMGVQLSGVDLPPPRFVVTHLEHALAVVDLSEQLIGEHPGSAWHTERELRRDALRRQREEGMQVLRADRPRTPDGALQLTKSRTVAIELDLTEKRPEVYDRLLGAYVASEYRQVWWFHVSKKARLRFEQLVRRKELTKLVEVHAWEPRLRGPGLALEG